MCQFHSVVGVALGNNFSIQHLPSNSHSEMSGELKNLPNRQPIIFEAEWDGSGDFPTDEKLIRNSGECPEKLKALIREHYGKLQAAITSGAYLKSYFNDANKWEDVWKVAAASGATLVLPSVFTGGLELYDGSKVDARSLTSVGGSLVLHGGSELDAPALTSVGGSLVLYDGSELDAPALREVEGKPYSRPK